MNVGWSFPNNYKELIDPSTCEARERVWRFFKPINVSKRKQDIPNAVSFRSYIVMWRSNFSWTKVPQFFDHENHVYIYIFWFYTFLSAWVKTSDSVPSSYGRKKTCILKGLFQTCRPVTPGMLEVSVSRLARLGQFGWIFSLRKDTGPIHTRKLCQGLAIFIYIYTLEDLTAGTYKSPI